ncbi:MAG: hypothetical protein DDT25_01275 [Chloroflexi bacterium]|nr:hypothetical protein [Chloroflexota bacterium]
MTISTDERRQAGRETWAWLSFAVFLVASMGLGAVFCFREVPAYLGYDMQRTLSGWEVIGTTLVALLVMSALVYVAAVCWLLFAKLFFSRAEVSKVVFYGPTTPVERWLVDKLFPKAGGDNRG